jgi:hypothetical protein
MPERFWEVVREGAFQEELDFLIPDEREADEFVEGAEFILARDPRAGDFIGGEPEIWVMPMAPVRGQQVGLFYTFNDLTVFFVSMRVIYPQIPPPMPP